MYKKEYKENKIVFIANKRNFALLKFALELAYKEKEDKISKSILRAMIDSLKLQESKIL